MLSKRVICGLVVCVGVALGVVTIVESAQGLRITSGTMLRVTQVRPSKDRGKGSNKGLSKGVLRALRRKFGARKYSSYTLVNTEVARARLRQEVTFELANGKKLLVRIGGYTPSKKTISLTIQMEDNIHAMIVPSGARRVFIIEKGNFPLTVVLYVKLLQVEN